jgi:hypothetical protein
MRFLAIINEQHLMMEQQVKALGNFAKQELFDVPFGLEMVKVPASGWSLEDIKEKVIEIANMQQKDPETLPVFVSPIPAMMSLMAKKSVVFFVFHNDKRDKIEKDGKVFFTVAQDGWQIV